jgi:hypothetical protein
MAATAAPPDPSLDSAGVAAMSDRALMERLDVLFRQKAALDGAIVVLLGEVGRREAYREEGATSAEPWVVERFGVSIPTARAYAHVAELAWDLPHLVASLQEGDITFDKLRAVADVATPETDRELRDQARECSVRELADVTKAQRGAPRADASYERRSLRFNDPVRTMTVQLPPESYAETRACLEARAREVPSDGETPWDQRLCDAFLMTIRSPAGGRVGSHLVVVHVPLDALVDESGDASGLAGELERDGLISCETVRRIACDATMAIAIDDDVGRTMFEGRARRDPTDAQRREIMRRDRHCRFPGCTNVTFTNVHHIRPWKPGGPTDIDNLAQLCLHHHRRVHSGGWTMSGNANAELRFVGPTGRVMTSRPSPLWTAVTSPAARRAAGEAGPGR